MIQIITHVHHDSNYHKQPPWFKLSHMIQIIAQHSHHNPNYHTHPPWFQLLHNTVIIIIQIIAHIHRDCFKLSHTMMQIIAHHDSNYRTQSPWFKLSHIHHDSNYRTQSLWFKLSHTGTMIQIIAHDYHDTIHTHHDSNSLLKLSHTATMIQIISRLVSNIYPHHTSRCCHDLTDKLHTQH